MKHTTRPLFIATLSLALAVMSGLAMQLKPGATASALHADTKTQQAIATAGSFPPSGNASSQSPVGTTKCVISDRDTRNDSCVCGEAAQPISAQGQGKHSS